MDIECGERHACGIDAEGSVRCWGAELTEEPPPGRFVKLAAGKGYNCAIDNARNLVCWGAGYYPPDVLPSNFALHAPSGQFDEVMLSNHEENLGCAWTTGGSMECWRNDAWMPVFPPDELNVLQIAGGVTICVLDAEGGASCSNARGDQDDAFEPVDPALRFVDVGVSGGLSYACGIASDQTLHCWGHPGDLRDRVESTLGAVAELTDFEAGPGYDACAQGASGRLACVGQRTYFSDGQFDRILSNGFEDPLDPPFTDWCINDDYGCVLREVGDVECWGDIPEEFPSDYVGDFYSCKLDGSTGEVNCTGQRPAHFGDDYW